MRHKHTDETGYSCLTALISIYCEESVVFQIKSDHSKFHSHTAKFDLGFLLDRSSISCANVFASNNTLCFRAQKLSNWPRPLAHRPCGTGTHFNVRQHTRLPPALSAHQRLAAPVRRVVPQVRVKHSLRKCGCAEQACSSFRQCAYRKLVVAIPGAQSKRCRKADWPLNYRTDEKHPKRMTGNFEKL